MDFYRWLELDESNLNDLYRSTVRAFPRTTKRQFAIDEIRIAGVSWVPYKGIRTLFAKGWAKNEVKGTEYKPMILFKDVKYHNSRNHEWAEIIASNGSNYFFEKLNLQNHVVLRCDCADFRWRFNYEDFRDRSLYGRVRKKYEAKENPGSSNPLELPGMCKHLIKLAHSLYHTGILEG